MNSDAPARLVLVVEVPVNGASTVIILLLSNFVEYATDVDVVLSSESTDLPFDLIAESDIVSTAWVWQLDRLVTQLPVAVVDAIAALPRLDDTEAMSLLRGMPLSGDTDVRWSWKEDEVLELQRLTADCIRTQLDVPTVDVGFLAVDGLPKEAIQHMALAMSELACSGCAVLPPSSAASLGLDDLNASEAMIETLGPDAWLAVHELLISTIGDEVPARTISNEPLPARRVQPGKDPLPAAVAKSRGTLRLMTWNELWRDSQPDVIEINVGGEIKRVVRERVAA
jgi:hypothetical protein